jgi:Zn-dependent protease
LTLNPLGHVSVFGSIILPIALYLFKAPVFGWAKPVPFDATNLEEHPRDQVWLAMAGPLSNFCLSFASYMLFLLSAPVFTTTNPGIALRIPLNLFAPLDLSGSTPEAFWFVWFEILAFGIVLNAILGVFNLLPFPPLDGSWILKAVLPKKAAVLYGKVQI